MPGRLPSSEPDWYSAPGAERSRKAGYGTTTTVAFGTVPNQRGTAARAALHRRDGVVDELLARGEGVRRLLHLGEQRRGVGGAEAAGADRLHLGGGALHLLQAEAVDLLRLHARRGVEAHRRAIALAPLRVGGDGDRLARGGEVLLGEEVTVAADGGPRLLLDRLRERLPEGGVAVALGGVVERRLDGRFPRADCPSARPPAARSPSAR